MGVKDGATRELNGLEAKVGLAPRCECRHLQERSLSPSLRLLLSSPPSSLVLVTPPLPPPPPARTEGWGWRGTEEENEGEEEGEEVDGVPATEDVFSSFWKTRVDVVPKLTEAWLPLLSRSRCPPVVVEAVGVVGVGIGVEAGEWVGKWSLERAREDVDEAEETDEAADEWIKVVEEEDAGLSVDLLVMVIVDEPVVVVVGERSSIGGRGSQPASRGESGPWGSREKDGKVLLVGKVEVAARVGEAGWDLVNRRFGVGEGSSEAG